MIKTNFSVESLEDRNLLNNLGFQDFFQPICRPIYNPPICRVDYLRPPQIRKPNFPTLICSPTPKICNPVVPVHNYPAFSFSDQNGVITVKEGFSTVIIGGTTVITKGIDSYGCYVNLVWWGDPHITDLNTGITTEAKSNILTENLNNMLIVGTAGASNSPLISTVVVGHGFDLVVNNQTNQISSFVIN